MKKLIFIKKELISKIFPNIFLLILLIIYISIILLLKLFIYS